MADDKSKKTPYILVGEDEDFIASIFRVKFEKEGFDVDVMKNGQEVMDSLKKRVPDILLLDLIMPIKDGFEVLKEIRADNKLKDLKVLVVSNLGQEEDKRKVLELGALDYCIKANMRFSEIVDKVKGYLNLK